MSGRLIGVLTSESPIIALFASSMWSGLADATRNQRKILILTVCGTILSAFGIFLGNSFYALIIAVVIFSLFNSPIMPLVDSTAMRILKGEEHRYGKLRFWGAVGWGIRKMLIIAVVSLIIRLIAYSIVSTAWAVLAIQLFHRRTFCCNRRPGRWLDVRRLGRLSDVSVDRNYCLGADYYDSAYLVRYASNQICRMSFHPRLFSCSK